MWWYGSEPVLVNPLAAFGNVSPVEVFYVQGGLKVNEAYETTITLTRAGQNRSVLSVNFEEVARRPVEAKRRALELVGVDPGKYRLEVSIRRVGSNREVRRVRTIHVVTED